MILIELFYLIATFTNAIEYYNTSFVSNYFDQRKKRAILNGEINKWTKKSLLYFVNSKVSRNFIKSALIRIQKETCFKFVRAPSLKHADLYFTWGAHYTTNLGKNKKTHHTIFVSIFHQDIGKTVREVLRALGIDYEHNRFDRDKYITVNKHNILPLFLPLFLTNNIFKVTTYNTEYDYRSIMHFTNTEYAIRGLRTFVVKDKLMKYSIGRTNHLSFNDAKLLNLKYCTNTVIMKHTQCHNNGYPIIIPGRLCKCLPFFYGPKCQYFVLNKQHCSRINKFKAKPFFSRRTLNLGGNCYFLFETKPGYRIKLMIFFFRNMISQHNCSHDEILEILYRKDLSVGGAIICPNFKPVRITSQSNRMVLHSNYANKAYKIKVLFMRVP
uniref:Metalloendopeptidase n=1 Tax=Strongyloides venezuelensis TaxID=75913 RepID=A0A0K0FTU2_STRVS